jgi:hypothetical protein
MSVKVKPTKNAAAGPTAITGDLDKDIALTKAWLDFRGNLIKQFEECDSVAVELGFESSFDDKTHHSFNTDEAVFVSDIKVCPKNRVVFVVPYGAKEKSFHYDEAELINIVNGGASEPLNGVINRVFRESFKDFSDISTITMLERKYLNMAGLSDIFNDAENYISNIELTKDRSKLYSKLHNFGIF